MRAGYEQTKPRFVIVTDDIPGNGLAVRTHQPDLFGLGNDVSDRNDETGLENADAVAGSFRTKN